MKEKREEKEFDCANFFTQILKKFFLAFIMDPDFSKTVKGEYRVIGAFILLLDNIYYWSCPGCLDIGLKHQRCHVDSFVHQYESNFTEDIFTAFEEETDGR